MSAIALGRSARSRPLWRAAAITASAALIANVAIYGLANALLTVPDRLTPLRLGASRSSRSSA